MSTQTTLNCDGTPYAGGRCDRPVTHIDRKGYIYCAQHGAQRRLSQPCRRLTLTELAQLGAGQTISRY